MRVLGVDPGLTRCGLGVVDGAGAGRRATLVEVGVVRTPHTDDIAARLRDISIEIDAWLDRTRPDAVAVERVFSQANVRTVMGTAQAGAVAIVLAARRGLPVALYTPSEVKAAVTGSGRADKTQVTFMISRLLDLAEPPRPADAADALALALCHVWRGPALARIRAAGVGIGARAAGAGAGASAGAVTTVRTGPGSTGPATLGTGAAGPAAPGSLDLAAPATVRGPRRAGA